MGRGRGVCRVVFRRSQPIVVSLEIVMQAKVPAKARDSAATRAEEERSGQEPES